MRKLGTVDLQILDLAIKENGTFNENNLENSELKRLGVGRILDTLASLKDRKLVSLNSDGSFSITDLAREILWSNNIPTWAKILRLLQIKSCSMKQIADILRTSEDKLIEDVEKLRKNQFVLMIAGLRAGNVGINLTRAKYVIFAELDWSPAIHRQAEDRLHRIGQKNTVFAYYLIGNGTLDDHVANILVDKSYEIDEIMDESKENYENKDKAELILAQIQDKIRLK